MRILVTGGSGKLGQYVVADLVDHGHDVVNVDLVPAPEPRCPFVRADLSDHGRAVDAFTAVSGRFRELDGVVHLSAIPAPGLAGNAEIFGNNVRSTFHVLAAARLAGVRRVVTASSETVLGLPFDTPPPYLPVDEEYPARPESSYALGKHLEEQMAIQFCRQDPTLAVSALRFSNVMRPADYADFPGFQDDPRQRSWNLWGYIDARDGAQAVRRALGYDQPGFEAFIIANAETVMTTPSAQLATAVFPDVPRRRELVGTETLLGIDKARRLLGYEPEHHWYDQS